MKKYKWGIIGTGNIARKFCFSLKYSEKSLLYAVGSRSKEKAMDFAEEFSAEKAYGSYEELLEDRNIDVVYIATPHSFHLENTLMALEKGKHVLCEKPMSLNYNEVRMMRDEAVKRNLFLMEALWPPFQPSYIKAGKILDEGKYGRVLHVNGKFGFNAGYDPERRTYNPDLGGGALLDVGIYPVMDILRFMGMPDGIEAWSKVAPTGVDESTSMMFRYSDGRTAEAYCSFKAPAGISTEINCEEGNILLSRTRSRVQKLILDSPEQKEEEILFEPESFGFQYEAEEVARCLDRGLKESPVVPHAFSLDLIKILDTVRSKTGIIYHGRD